MDEFQIMGDFGPSESYSRQLDRRVAAQEMPYGYSFSPPLAGHENSEAKKSARDQDYGPKRRK